jgi:hypothetical protein
LNIVLGPEGPMKPQRLEPEHYDKLMLYAAPIPSNQEKMRSGENTSWIRGAVGPKIIARRSMIRGLTPGMHDAVVTDGEVRRAVADDLLVAHLALSTITRFAAKVQNIRNIYARAGVDLSLPGETWQESGTAWHWRRWAEASTPEQLACEFGRNILGPAQVAQLLQEGVVRSACEVLALRRGLTPKSTATMGGTDEVGP